MANPRISWQGEWCYEEVLVSLPNQRLNNLGTTGGAKSVLLRCPDKKGRVTVHQRWPWPLVVEPGYPPHIHQPAVAKVLDTLGSCRLTGPGETSSTLMAQWPECARTVIGLPGRAARARGS